MKILFVPAKTKMNYIILFVLLWMSFNKVDALPFGAPLHVCQSMYPFHDGGISSQLTPSPFEVTANQTNLGLIVSIKSTSNELFQGVMLQARLANDNIGGTFEPLNNLVHTINCRQQRDTVTHNNVEPMSLLELRWIPPNDYQGPVIFNSTVVQNYSIFWVGVQSKSLQISSNLQNNNITKLDRFYEGCSITKLCFGVPDNCVEKENCKAVTAITVKGSRYEFEMKATGNPAWVGVGLSDDQIMGDDSVIECVKNENSVEAYLSWTVAGPKLDANRLQNQHQGIELKNFSVADGVLYCQVVRDAKTSINERDFDLDNNKYHILIAAGTIVEKNKVRFHDIAYLASPASSFLSEIAKVEREDSVKIF